MDQPKLFTAARQGPTVTHSSMLASCARPQLTLGNFAEFGMQFLACQLKDAVQALGLDLQVTADHVVGDAGVAQPQR